MTRITADWWQQTDQFDWLMQYLHARGLALQARVLMALISSALLFMAFSAITTPRHPLLLSAAVAVISGAFGAGYTVLWLRRWPSRRQSLVMGVVGGVLVAVGSVMNRDPVIALMGCTGLAITGGYLAFFHSTRTVVFNIVVAAVAGAVCAGRVVTSHGDISTAAAGLWLVVELNLAVPLAIQTIVRTLGADVVRSDHDALTGVLNRRAFYERATALLTTPREELRLIVIMIDLDKFKALNDTYGHIAGDEALTAVGWVLRRAASPTAIIGRAGGEEFVIIDTVRAADAEDYAARLCTAVAALPHSITASVGAAVVHWNSVEDPQLAIRSLVRTADSAMYRAKRDGGNRSLVHRSAMTDS